MLAQLHSGVLAVATRGVQLMLNLAASAANVPALTPHVDVPMAALKVHKSSENLAVQTMFFLANLARSMASKATLLQHVIPAQVRSAMCKGCCLVFVPCDPLFLCLGAVDSRTRVQLVERQLLSIIPVCRRC